MKITLAQNLRKLRRDRDLTQEELAGFLGILTVFFIDALLVMSCKSIGAPYTAPIVPREKQSFISTILNVPIWKKEYRPEYLKPRDKQNQGKISRKWMYKRK